MNTYYTQYYLRQAGGSISDIGGLYRAPGFLQRGRGAGVGSFFSGLIKFFRPLVSSGLSALKDQTLKSTQNIIADIGHKPLKQILQEQGKVAVSNLADRELNKLRKMQQQRNEQKGNGRIRRKKRIKRGKITKKNHSKIKRVRKRSRKKQKTIASKQIGGKKRRKSVKKINNLIGAKKTRFVDIFDNNN